MTVETGLRFSAEPLDADAVHCNTWCSAMGGVLAGLAYGLLPVVIVHFLEPLRPWKRDNSDAATRSPSGWNVPFSRRPMP